MSLSRRDPDDKVLVERRHAVRVMDLSNQSRIICIGPKTFCTFFKTKSTKRSLHLNYKKVQHD